MIQNTLRDESGQWTGTTSQRMMLSQGGNCRREYCASLHFKVGLWDKHYLLMGIPLCTQKAQTEGILMGKDSSVSGFLPKKSLSR